jgi:signal transduction histidine kinase
MKRSFKLRLFMAMMCIAIVVLVANRLIATALVNQQTATTLHLQMQTGIQMCAYAIERQDLFLGCYKTFAHERLIKNLSDEFVLCQEGTSTNPLEQDPPCSSAQSGSAFWAAPMFVNDKQVQGVINTLNGRTWHAVRLTGHPETQLFLNEVTLQGYLHDIWKIRDDTLIFVAPILLALLIGATLIQIRFAMTPIESLQAALKRVNTRNLGKSDPITSPYREFQDFVAVYDDLCRRLDTSFTKARRFSSDAAHELRTPLAILRGNAEQLMGKLPVGSEAQIHARKISDEIERLIAMSEDLLLLSKADAQLITHDLDDFQISAFLKQLAYHSSDYHPHLTVKKSIEPHLIWHCNQRLIQQLIHNLYTNAVKYNTPKGWIKFSLHRDGDMLELSLENTVTSVPADLPQKAFDRFYRGNPDRNRDIEGLGLGLSICNEIAALHQGTLTMEVTSQPTVIVRFRAPRAAPRTPE